MESSVINDIALSEIRAGIDRVRFVGKLKSFDDKIGTFVVEDEGVNVTCLQNFSDNPEINLEDHVMVTGRVIPADSSFEVRADNLQKININDYNNYKKYLKIRKDLLNHGSRI